MSSTEFTVVQALEKAWSYIDTPEKWTQYSFARDEYKQHVEIDSPDAVCFCSVGALQRVLNLTDEDERAMVLYAQCKAVIEGLFKSSLMSLNDGAPNHARVEYYWTTAIVEAKRMEKRYAN